MSTPKTLTRLEIEHLPNFRRKTAHEWSASCPRCGGEDRFLFWPDDGGFWCRQCDYKGFAVEGKGDGVDWQRIALAEAARRAQAERDSAVALAEVAKLVPTVARYHANLLDKEKRALWYTWGLTDESIDKFRLGYAFSCPTCVGSPPAHPRPVCHLLPTFSVWSLPTRPSVARWLGLAPRSIWNILPDSPLLPGIP